MNWSRMLVIGLIVVLTLGGLAYIVTYEGDIMEGRRSPMEWMRQQIPEELPSTDELPEFPVEEAWGRVSELFSDISDILQNSEDYSEDS